MLIYFVLWNQTKVLNKIKQKKLLSGKIRLTQAKKNYIYILSRAREEERTESIYMRENCSFVFSKVLLG